MNDSPSDERVDAPPIDAGAVYSATAARRVAFDQMLWQVPALSLAAQSLLVTVGVDRDNDAMVRVLALLLATLFAVLSIQLMAKQRFGVQVDTQYLKRWEHARGMTVEGFAPHDHPTQDTVDGQSKADSLKVPSGWFVSRSSYTLWTWGLRGFLVAILGLLLWVPFSTS